MSQSLRLRRNDIGPILSDMSLFPRYAIYYVPDQSGELFKFGSGVIGYNAFGGADVNFPREILDRYPDWAGLTRDPRKYGFHATLKAPFVLRAGASESDLIGAVTDFAGKQREAIEVSPAVRLIGNFVAIVPTNTQAGLNALARDCVIAFDDFRAPLTEQDRARRNPEALTSGQRLNLDRWGYPYVMDDFRFHMTLTGSLPSELSEAVLKLLQQSFASLHIDRLPIDRICVLKQESDCSQFKVIACRELH